MVRPASYAAVRRAGNGAPARLLFMARGGMRVFSPLARLRAGAIREKTAAARAGIVRRRL